MVYALYEISTNTALGIQYHYDEMLEKVTVAGAFNLIYLATIRCRSAAPYILQPYIALGCIQVVSIMLVFPLVRFQPVLRLDTNTFTFRHSLFLLSFLTLLIRRAVYDLVQQFLVLTADPVSLEELDNRFI